MELTEKDKETIEKSSEYQLVTIKSDSKSPDLLNTVVRNVETGEIIPNVTNIELTLDAENEECYGVLYLYVPIKVVEIEHVAKVEIVKEEKQ